MANQLSVAKVHSILTLHERGWSQRQIAASLGVDRETVARYVHLTQAEAGSKPATQANAPPGSEASDGAKPATEAANALTGSVGVDGTVLAAGGSASIAGGAPPGSRGQAVAVGPQISRSGPASDCQAHRERILAKLELGLSAVRIHQDLLDELGANVPSYHSVRRYVARLRGGTPDAFRRIEVAPGVEAQVDFGKGAPIVKIGPTGKPRRHRVHVLRVVLSHSRAGYSEVVERQTTENFIRCIENAFHHFGGVPTTLILDNLRAAVSKADWFDPELNPKVQSFFAHYGVVALPTKPYTPRHKGKIERGIDYVQDNGLKGRQFSSIAEENAHLRQWEINVADTRIHGTTQKQVRQLFEQAEKPALQSLPATRFPCFEEGQRSVHRDGHVRVAYAYYSVPPEYLGHELWVRYDARLVRIFDGRMQLIVTHPRKEPGQFSTLDQHIVDRKIAGVERGAAWLLHKVGNIGPQSQRWAEAMVQHRGIEGVRVLQGLISFAQRHPGEQVERACRLALEHGAWRLRTIREIVKRDLHHSEHEHPQQVLPGVEAFIDEHPIIRSLHDYSRFVHDAFLQPASMTEAHS